MRKAGLFCKTKKRLKATTDSSHDKPIASNLLDRQFSVIQPDRYYVGDITYIVTQEGWLFLAIVIDFFSRKIFYNRERIRSANGYLLPINCEKLTVKISKKMLKSGLPRGLCALW